MTSAQIDAILEAERRREIYDRWATTIALVCFGMFLGALAATVTVATGCLQ